MAPFDPTSVHLVANPDAGSGLTVDDLCAVAPEAVCHELGDRDITTVVRRAMADGATVIGVAGGDGTARAAASELVDSDVALLPIPGGTRNHFARDLGVDDLDAVAAVLRDGESTRIDVGQIGDRIFLNNATVGWYANVVRDKSALEDKLPRRVARLLTFAGHAVRRRSFDVDVTADLTAEDAPGSEAHRCWMIWIGNNVFGVEPATLAERESHDEGLLDLRLLVDQGALSKGRAVLRLLRGAIEDSDHLHREATPRAVLHFRDQTTVDVTVDGEVVQLAAPLDVRIRRRALRVVRPRSHPG